MLSSSLARIFWPSEFVEGYYREHADSYRNPHTLRVQTIVRDFLPSLDLSNVLDLACGSGEVTQALPSGKVTGCDPFTRSEYVRRTGKVCLPLSFEHIAKFGLSLQYSLIICSYALHLCQKTVLPTLIWQLSQAAPKLLVITPIKRPVLKREWGFELEKEVLWERTKGRLYVAR